MVKDIIEGLTGGIYRAWGHAGLGGTLFMLLLCVYLVGHWSGWWFGSESSRITMLQQLHSMSLAGIEQDSNLAPIYYDIVAEMMEPQREVVTVTTPMGRMQESTVYKFLGGAAIWALMLGIIPFVKTYQTRKSKLQAYAAVVFFMLLSGGLSAVIPDFPNLWINYLLVPGLTFFLLLVAGIKQNNKDRTKS